jgi:thioester reductase-like protein
MAETATIPQTITNTITNIEVGSIQVSERLGNHNFQLWSRSIILTLHERELYEHITGEERKPDESKVTEFRQWRRNDYKAINLMLNSMEHKTKQLFMFHDSSRKLWEAMNTHFSQKRNFSHIYQLKTKIQMLKQSQKPMI